MTFEQLEALWKQAAQAQGAPQNIIDAAPIMAAIALGESRGNENAQTYEPSPGGGMQFSSGLWQISAGANQPAVTGWNDPLTNATDAVKKLEAQGFGAWNLPNGLDNNTAWLDIVNERYNGSVISQIPFSDALQIEAQSPSNFFGVGMNPSNNPINGTIAATSGVNPAKATETATSIFSQSFWQGIALNFAFVSLGIALVAGGFVWIAAPGSVSVAKIAKDNPELLA